MDRKRRFSLNNNDAEDVGNNNNTDIIALRQHPKCCSFYCIRNPSKSKSSLSDDNMTVFDRIMNECSCCIDIRSLHNDYSNEDLTRRLMDENWTLKSSSGSSTTTNTGNVDKWNYRLVVDVDDDDDVNTDDGNESYADDVDPAKNSKTTVYQQQRQQPLADDDEKIWIFGYGSICWNPGFQYDKSMTGFIEGYSRKFWQGSITHRGTGKNPGRVVTLIEEEDKQAIVWGRVFQVRKNQAEVMDYLEHRECSSGGYIPMTITVQLKDYLNHGLTDEAVSAVTFIALADNYLWLGNATLTDISSQIVSCKGHAGHNIEYLLRLADYMRHYIPEETDIELFALETLVMRHIRDNQLSLKDIMGELSFRKTVEDAATDQQTTDVQPAQMTTVAPPNNAAVPSSSYSSSINSSMPSTSSSGKFASRIPDKKLRCLNI